MLKKWLGAHEGAEGGGERVQGGSDPHNVRQGVFMTVVPHKPGGVVPQQIISLEKPIYP